MTRILTHAIPIEESPIMVDLRARVRSICAQFPDAYWRDLDAQRTYPVEFIQTLIRVGLLATLIPVEFGGRGYGLMEAAAILEEINRNGGNSGPAHAQMYVMSLLVRHGSDDQKRRILPAIARGELRLQAFAVTEPDAGSDTSSITTTATRRGDCYVVTGRKIYISRIQHSDLMVLLARTSPRDPTKPTAGMSTLLLDLRDVRDRMKIRPLRMMMNNETNEVEFNGVEVPAENLIGIEGNGFRQILDGWNAERILIAAECIGDGRWFVDRATRYASDRIVFGRPIGANQGVQFPIAAAHTQVEAADLMCRRAAVRFDAGLSCGADANMAKFLAAEASWAAANACLDTFGGNGFNADFDIERKFRETRLYRIAPISNNLVLAYVGHRVLGMPRSY